jgi:hypothetical protein
LIPLKENTLYDWLNNYEEFSYEFKRFCVVICQAFDLECRFDETVLKNAHNDWKEECEAWRTQHFGRETEALSHIKVLALLLFHFSRVPFIANLYDHEFSSDRDYTFSGNDEQRASVKADIDAGREALLTLDFCIGIICAYEEARTDRKDPFQYRLTLELRHDIISFLLARGDDSKALYLILEALFVRRAR